MTDYATFLESKKRTWVGCGEDIPVSALPSGLKDFQASLTRWALKKGRAAKVNLSHAETSVTAQGSLL